MATVSQAAPGVERPPKIVAIPIRHWGRWISAVIILFVAFAMLWSLWHNPNVDISTIRHNLFAPYVLRGVVVTIELTIIAMVIGLVGGVLLAVMRLSPNPVLKTVAWAYIWFFRGTPILVQILFWGFVGALYKNIFVGLPFTGIVFGHASTSRLHRRFHRGDPGARPERGGLRRRARARRHHLGRPRPVRSGPLARHVGRPDHAPHRAAPGHAGDHPAHGQRDDLHAQDHGARLGNLGHRPHDQHPAGLLAELQDDSAAAGGQHLVPGSHLRDERRPVLPRAPLRAGLRPERGRGRRETGSSGARIGCPWRPRVRRHSGGPR